MHREPIRGSNSFISPWLRSREATLRSYAEEDIEVLSFLVSRLSFPESTATVLHAPSEIPLRSHMPRLSPNFNIWLIASCSALCHVITTPRPLPEGKPIVNTITCRFPRPINSAWSRTQLCLAGLLLGGFDIPGKAIGNDVNGRP
jgi:hypothetical protein